MTKKILLFFALVVHAFVAASQVRGTVTDNKGEPLPFVSIYVQGTTNGTTSNLNGEYSLVLERGTYQLVFQYIGYKQRIETVKVEAGPVKLNVTLAEEAIELASVEIKANAEDPAYPIIRKAIENGITTASRSSHLPAKCTSRGISRFWRPQNNSSARTSATSMATSILRVRASFTSPNPSRNCTSSSPTSTRKSWSRAR
ncbi:MAG: carboxypeptidase-like regulatory domain-containing protein [Saprospiraceae bacterium]|nr:carboxypeptidase-like regulatory domain-containing protein [Saprospiraceae bacterium]